MAMNTEDSLREYLRLFVKVPLVGRIGPLARTFDFVADAAPGVKEILAVGKLVYEVRERHYDLVVVDAEASGHIVAQIAAPRVIGELVQVGLVRDQTRWMTEHPRGSRRDRSRGRDDTGGDARRRDDRAARPPRPGDRRGPGGGRRQPGAAGAVRPPAVRGGRPTRPRSSRCSSMPPVRASSRCSPRRDVTEARRRTGNRHLERLRDGLPSALPVLYVPELFTRATGRRVVALVAKALAEELDVS